MAFMQSRSFDEWKHVISVIYLWQRGEEKRGTERRQHEDSEVETNELTIISSVLDWHIFGSGVSSAIKSVFNKTEVIWSVYFRNLWIKKGTDSCPLQSSHGNDSRIQLVKKKGVKESVKLCNTCNRFDKHLFVYQKSGCEACLWFFNSLGVVLFFAVCKPPLRFTQWSHSFLFPHFPEQKLESFSIFVRLYSLKWMKFSLREVQIH